MPATAVKIDLLGKPNNRILLRKVATKFGCTCSVQRVATDPMFIRGEVEAVIAAKACYQGIINVVSLRQAIIVASYPDLNHSTVEEQFMRGFVFKAGQILDGKPVEQEPRRVLGPFTSGINYALELLVDNEMGEAVD